MSSNGSSSPPLAPGKLLPEVKHPPNTTFFELGSSGRLYTILDRPTEVVKVPAPYEWAMRDLEIEKRVYGRLRSHPNLIRCLGTDDYGVYLERASLGNLREYYSRGSVATLREKVQWSWDTASVLYYIHQNNIRHGDLSGRNLLLDSKRTIRLCDFAGSFIDGESATIWAESGFRHPDENEYKTPTIQGELHALGSTIYEIVTGTKPYRGLEYWEIDRLLEERRYPSVSNLVIGEVMLKCWNGVFSSAAEVADDIKRTGMLCRNRRLKIYI